MEIKFESEFNEEKDSATENQNNVYKSYNTYIKQPKPVTVWASFFLGIVQVVLAVGFAQKDINTVTFMGNLLLYVFCVLLFGILQAAIDRDTE